MRNKGVKPILLYGLLVCSCQLSAQSPGGISRQSYWLQGGHAEATAKKNSLNFHPAIVIDDGNTRVKLPDKAGAFKRLTVFTVYRQPAPENEAAVWELSGEFGEIVHSTKQVSSKSRNSHIEFTGGGEAIISTYVASNRTRPSKEDKHEEPSIHFGNTSIAISELILYEKILSAKEVAKVETYLALKYGITLQKNYVSSAGKTVWDREKDKAYSNNIAGIARDDESTLYQKQGTSCNKAGELVIGVNKIAASNSSNADRLNNDDYLVWGDNGQSISLSTAELCAGDLKLPARRWLMRASGNTAGRIGTEIRLDIKPLLTASFVKEQFCLVIDRSGTGEFAPENSFIIMPDSISPDGVAIFKGVSWDTDRSGKDIFTFGLRAGLSHDSLVRIHF